MERTGRVAFALLFLIGVFVTATASTAGIHDWSCWARRGKERARHDIQGPAEGE